jgi:hypothetical protein
MRMHPGYQGACRIDYAQPPSCRFDLDGSRHPMRAKNDQGAIRDIGQIIDENRTLTLQFGDNTSVMDDLVAHMDPRTVQAQCRLDNSDGPHNSSAETAWLSQHDPKRMTLRK